jgi:hypothetical protein
MTKTKHIKGMIMFNFRGTFLPGCVALVVMVVCWISPGFAQEQTVTRCVTMEVLEKRFGKNPALKASFQQQELRLQQRISQRVAQPAAARREAIIIIPIVFHVVLTNQSLVTDAQIQAQLDNLNRDYAGENADTVNIPSYFKPLLGKSGIRFCLAQRTPDNNPTNGINRVTTSRTSFDVNSNSDYKFKKTGGADAWNHQKYLNVWISNLSNGVLGFATFPDFGAFPAEEQGVTINYQSLPGGSFTRYNGGKTLTHEIGHYFDLHHVWGDDNGACTGTDFIDDTPNQGNSSSGCLGGAVKLDNCSPTSPGVMYQNYMDYTDDNCLVMFTPQQVARMETAISAFRPTLFSSDGCKPLVQYARDAELRAVVSPAQRLCSPSFTPAVVIRNLGGETLTSLTIWYNVDNGAVSSFAWTGSLPTLASVTVNLRQLTVPEGDHVLNVYTSNPNANNDENPVNDTIRFAFIYYTPFSPPISESFEGNKFPPTGWDVVNDDGSVTWQKVTGVAKTGNSAVRITNFEYPKADAKDYLRLPQVNISNVDSAFFTFQVAAAVYDAPNTANNAWDTLEVLLSTDCGATYTSLYKKWGSSLITRARADTSFFIPAASEWRRDSIDLTPFINRGNVLVAFRNTNEYQNNIYLDDVNLTTKIVNPFLKAKGYLITPNPTSGNLQVQFYPTPVNLRGIAIYTLSGQKLSETTVMVGGGNSLYNFDLSRYPAGMYIVRAVFSDRVVTQKVVKVN